MWKHDRSLWECIRLGWKIYRAHSFVLARADAHNVTDVAISGGADQILALHSATTLACETAVYGENCVNMANHILEDAAR